MAGNRKIAVIGAGSLSHGKRLVDDLLTLREMEGGRLALMGTNFKRLDVVFRYAKRVAAAKMPSLDIEFTTERDHALKGAELVFSLFDAGGFPAFERDCGIASRYGLDFCIGDSVGPLGAMRALRNGRVMLELADAMGRICPGALLVNYANPMSMMVAVAEARGIECVGVCGGIEATRAYVARILGLERQELRTVFAGINHLAWLLEMYGPTGDLYPRFRELMRDPEIRGEETPRFEVLQQFGYFATESSGHISDFFPYFRRSPELRAKYCWASGFAGASGAYLKLSSFAQHRIGDADYLDGEWPSGARSIDFGPAIAEAVLGGRRLHAYGNVMNRRNSGEPALAGLPPDSCVELPILLEGRSLSIPRPPALPRVLAALCAPSAIQAGLVLEALLSEDPEIAFTAMAQDGLTSSVLDLPAIRRLASELLAANVAWLPAGLARPLRTTVDATVRPMRRHEAKGDAIVDLVRNYERRRRQRRIGSEPSRGS